MSRALKAVSDENRIRILEVLVQGERCVSDLVSALQIDQPKVSHHLAILRSAGVIKSRRDGRHINYSVRGSLHHREPSPEGDVDVFDLGDLAVSFRFGGSGGIGAVQGGLHPTPTPAPAPAPPMNIPSLEDGHATGHLP